MQVQNLQYRIIITPDKRTGSGQNCFTAFCPLLGVADDGDTIEESLHNIRGAIEAYVESLIEDGKMIPCLVKA
jgi:predicted RNase H-like HicB family nuclease